MRRAEGVVHVEVLALDQPVCTKAGSLAVSPGSKRRFSSSSTPGASSARRPRTGSIEYVGSGAPLGRPRWVQAVTVAPRSVQPLDGGQRGADAQVVGDLAVVRGDVEVGPEQDPRAVDVAEVLQRGDAHRSAVTLLVGRADDLRRGRPGGSSSPTRCRTSRGP